jgi:hypothetical protein
MFRGHKASQLRVESNETVEEAVNERLRQCTRFHICSETRDFGFCISFTVDVERQVKIATQASINFSKVEI